LNGEENQIEAGPADSTSRDEGRIWLLAVLVVVFIIALVARLLPLGPADQWTLSYRGDLNTQWNPVLVAIGFGLGMALGFIPMLRRYIGVPATIATICIVCIGLNLCLHRPLRGQLWLPRVVLVAFPHANPFFFQATQMVGVRDYVAKDLERAHAGYWAAPVHERRLTNYPPGVVILYGVIVRAAGSWPRTSSAIAEISLFELRPPLERADLQIPIDDSIVAAASMVALFHLFCIAFIPLGVYLVTRRLWDQEIAIKLAACSAVIPSVHLFAAMPDAIVPVLGLAAIWTAVESARNHSKLILVANVAILGIGGNISYSLAPIAFMCGSILLLLNPESPWRNRLSLFGSWLGFGCVAVLAAALFGVRPIGRFLLAMANNQAFYEKSGRGYFESLLYNGIEMVVFGGVIWSVLFIAKSVREGRLLRRHSIAAVSDGGRLILIVGVTMALLLLSGGARLEVSRNWMLMTPYLVLGAADSVADRSRWQYLLWMMVVVVVAMALVLECSFNF